MNGKYKDLISIFAAVFVICLMVAASEFFNEKEIIFPEIAALCTGCFLAPALSWNTDYKRMFLCITFCAVLGTGIVLFVPLPLWIQFLIAFMAGQIVLFASQSSFAPMISAICLPVLIQTRSVVYIIAAASLTLLLVLLRMLFEKSGIKEKRVFVPAEINSSALRTTSRLFALRTFVIFVIAFLAIKSNQKFIVAPPLLVAFVELTNHKSKATERKLHAAILTILCALTGAALRFTFCMQLGLPLTLAALFTAVLFMIYLRLFKFYFPPAAAMAILAFLIPEQAVIHYPVQVAGGMLMLCVSAVLIQKMEILWKND